MAALDGVVILRSQRGMRRISAADFYQGVMTTALAEDELVVAAELPMLPEGTLTGFKEFSRRKGDFAIAMALVTYRLESGAIVEPRVAIGGAETHPRRLREVEAVLGGETPNEGVFSAAGDQDHHQRNALCRDRRTTTHACRRHPRRLWANGHAYRLRARRVRCLHNFT